MAHPKESTPHILPTVPPPAPRVTTIDPRVLPTDPKVPFPAPMALTPSPRVLTPYSRVRTAPAPHLTVALLPNEASSQLPWLCTMHITSSVLEIVSSSFCYFPMFIHEKLSVLDIGSRKSLEYLQLRLHTKYSKIWNGSYFNK